MKNGPKATGVFSYRQTNFGIFIYHSIHCISKIKLLKETPRVSPVHNYVKIWYTGGGWTADNPINTPKSPAQTLSRIFQLIFLILSEAEKNF